MKEIKDTLIGILLLFIVVCMIHTILFSYVKFTDEEPRAVYPKNIDEVSPLPKDWEETYPLWNKLIRETENELTGEYDRFRRLIYLDDDEKANYAAYDKALQEAWDGAVNIRRLVDEISTYDAIGFPDNVAFPTDIMEYYGGINRQWDLLEIYLDYIDLMKKNGEDYFPVLAKITKLSFIHHFSARRSLDWLMSFRAMRAIYNVYGEDIYKNDPDTFALFEKWAENWKSNFLRVCKLEGMVISDEIWSDDFNLKIDWHISRDISFESIRVRSQKFYYENYSFQPNKTVNTYWDSIKKIETAFKSGKRSDIEHAVKEIEEILDEQHIPWNNYGGAYIHYEAYALPYVSFLNRMMDMEESIKEK